MTLKVVENAKKILGPKAQVPEPIVDLQKVVGSWEGNKKKIEQAVQVLEKLLLEGENTLSSYRNAIGLYKKVIDGQTFGLDPKADGKKITEAKKTFEVFFTGEQKVSENWTRELDSIVNGLVRRR